MDANEMSKAYEPGLVEDALYAAWVKSGYFSPENLPGNRTEPFSIVLPPPNVTGTLHMGHAVMLAIEDAMVRIARLQGKKALWIPGTDHAAIATQSKVEKMILKEEGRSRHDLGREPFLRRVEQFARDSHDIIVDQAKKMGASLDWTREAYTLDEKRNRAVRVAFKKLYDLGLIYRGFRVVNWDPVGQTTISDDEMVYKEGKAMLYTFRYGKDVPIAISTTRPETKVGDTAIAVHPEDARYKDFIGKSYTCDFAGTTITVRVIADEEVDPAFGTGALGVTPAHSAIDADMAKRHNVPMIQVIGEDARMLPAAGSLLDGKSVKEAREEVVNWLRGSGLLEKEEEIDQNISTAERTGGIVEPLPKLQWFIDVNKPFTAHGKTATLKERMIEAVEGGAVNILPDRFNKTYFHWINNLRDWCISRQIWFGHRIPVWYRGDEMIVGVEAPEGEGWEQDSDTLDTWFSSGLWTFSTLGWPETKIIFVRHGQAASNVKQIVDGDLQDHHNHLTEKGKEQIEVLAEEIKSSGATRIIASPVLRTRETADILSARLDLPVSFDNRLREVGGGIYEGAKAADYEEARGDVAIWRENHAGGIETFEEVKARAEDFIREVVVAHAGETIIVVSHGDPLGLLQTTGAGLPDEARMGAYPKTGGHIVRTFGTDGSQQGDLSFYHPTSVLETGYDIIFFWVARMILMSTALMGEVPFKTVYLHGLVRDEQGRKMSKSLDNIINPLDMIAQYGADATRLSLVISSTPGNDTKLSEEKVAGFRNFTNKLWNISRFVFMTVGGAHHVSSVGPQTLSDRWILGRLSEVIEATTRHASRHEYSLYGEVLREFTWGDFADWYLEIAKIEKGKEEILLYVLERILILWHPFMPFVTEEIYKQFENGMLIVGEWPKANHTMGAGDAAEFVRLQTIITDVRNLRATYKLDPKATVDAVVAGTETEPAIIRHLARINNLTFGAPSKDIPSVGTASVALYLPESFDPAREKARLSEELADAKRYAASVEAKLNNQEFVGRAPAAVIEKEKQKLAETTARIEAIEAQLKTLAS